MRLIKYCLLFLLFISKSTQSQETVSKIEKLRFSSIKTRFSLSGSSISSDIWGRFSNGNYFPWLNILENPAFFTGINSPMLIFNTTPGQKYSLSKLYDISSLINDEIDNNIISYKSDNLVIDYPSFDMQIKRDLLWPEGIIVFPVEQFTVGVMFHRSFLLSLDFDVIGTEASISTELNSGAGSNKVTLNNYIDAINQFDYSATSTSFFASRIINKKFIAGIRLERLYYNLDVKSNFNIQGSMYFNGKEYLFNDPETLWPTDISQNLIADYSGTAWRMIWGGMYVLHPNLSFDGAINLISSADLTGELTGNRNKIPALNIDALESGDDVDEILDAEKLDLDQLTYTENIGWEEYPVLNHTIPHFLKIGMFYKMGKWSFYLSDQIFFGSYKLNYGDDFIEINPSQFLKLHISCGGFFSKLGVFIFKYYSPEKQDISFNSSSIPAPVFSLGYGKKIFNRTVIVGNFELLPMPWLNIGVQYTF